MLFNLSQTSLYSSSLNDLPAGKLLITTLNAHSYNVAQHDPAFAEALQNSDVLLPDGVSVVWAYLTLTLSSRRGDKSLPKLKKIAGEDLFYWEMKRMQQQAVSVKQQTAKVFFLGSTEEVLSKIKERAGVEFPDVEVLTYSPPFKAEFTEDDNRAMYEAIQAVQPDVLFIGMTAPKQEKWAYQLVNPQPLKGSEENKERRTYPPLGVRGHCHICCIGAVFDFYAGTVHRAPQWMIKIHLEWFYRLIKEPRRMWRRYLIGNLKFVWGVVLEKCRM